MTLGTKQFTLFASAHVVCALKIKNKLTLSNKSQGIYIQNNRNVCVDPILYVGIYNELDFKKTKRNTYFTNKNFCKLTLSF